MKSKCFLEYNKKFHIYILLRTSMFVIRGGLFMKFFKKHKLLSFAVISFITLSGVNFYLIFELVRVIRRVIWDQVSRKRDQVFSDWDRVFFEFAIYEKQIKKYALH